MSDPSIVEGFCATEHRNSHGTVVRIAGCDTASFLSHGTITWNGSGKPEDVIGVPLAIEERTTPDGTLGLWLRACLIDSERANDVISLMRALPPNKQLGWSVAGMVEEQAGNEILRCRLHAVMITDHMDDPHTAVTLVDDQPAP